MQNNQPALWPASLNSFSSHWLQHSFDCAQRLFHTGHLGREALHTDSGCSHAPSAATGSFSGSAWTNGLRSLLPRPLQIFLHATKCPRVRKKILS